MLAAHLHCCQNRKRCSSGEMRRSAAVCKSACCTCLCRLGLTAVPVWRPACVAERCRTTYTKADTPRCCPSGWSKRGIPVSVSHVHRPRHPRHLLHLEPSLPSKNSILLSYTRRRAEYLTRESQFGMGFTWAEQSVRVNRGGRGEHGP